MSTHALRLRAEAERRIFIPHQADIGQDSERPPVEAHDKVKKTDWIAPGKQQGNRGEENEHGF